VGVEVEPVPRWDWSPLPREGCHGVEGRVLLTLSPDSYVSMLRFGRDATIDEHADDEHVHEVICLEGSGYTSVGGEQAPIRAGERVTWPPGVMHGLWTEGEEMTTLMVARPRN
jgi:quercetin dioxygenase-like cupin family protein